MNALRCFQPGEGPSRGLLRDCEIFANLRIAFVSSSSVFSVWSAVAWRDGHVEHHGGVAGQVVDVARRGVDEQNLAVRAHPVA